MVADLMDRPTPPDSEAEAPASVSIPKIVPKKAKVSVNAEPLSELEVALRENEKMKRKLLALNEAKKESKQQSRVSLILPDILDDILDDIVIAIVIVSFLLCIVHRKGNQKSAKVLTNLLWIVWPVSLI